MDNMRINLSNKRLKRCNQSNSIENEIYQKGRETTSSGEMGSVVPFVKRNILLIIVTFFIISLTTGLFQTDLLGTSSYYVHGSIQPNENITITALFNQMGRPDMVKELLNDAINKSRLNHPDLDINLKYIELHDLTHNATKGEMIKTISNGTHIDIISLDQI